jgi:hypothetical protein
MPPKLKKIWFKPYNYILKTKGTQYYVKTLNITPKHILTINSKYIWELKFGKVNGSQFKTIYSSLINLKDFYQLQNLIIVFKGRPHKILKYLNESEVVDISNETIINNIKIFNNLSECMKNV